MNAKYFWLLLAFVPIGALFLGANILYEEMLRLNIVPEHIENVFDVVMSLPKCLSVYEVKNNYEAGIDVFFYIISLGSVFACYVIAGCAKTKYETTLITLYRIISGATLLFYIYCTFTCWSPWFPGYLFILFQIVHTISFGLQFNKDL